MKKPVSTQAPNLKNLGFSWKNLRQQAKPSKMSIIPGSIVDTKERQQTEDMPFTQEDLEFQWLSMCNRMPEHRQELAGIATRMKNMNPVITQLPQVEVTVDNALIKQEMENIQKSIVKTLQIYLRNNQITLSILVSDKPQQTKILSRREQFELMSKENPAVEKLRQEFNLELA